MIIVTDDDLANLSIALDARRMNPQAAIVVRQFDQELAVHLEQSAEIDRALSASALAAPPFVAAALGTTVRCCFAAGDAICNVGEDGIDAGPRVEGRTLGQWSAGTGQAALAVRRGRAGDRSLRPGHADCCPAIASSLSAWRTIAPAKMSRTLPLRAARSGISGFRRFWMGVPPVVA